MVFIVPCHAAKTLASRGGQTVALFSCADKARLAAAPLVVEQESRARFEGELCLIRFEASGQPQWVIYAQILPYETAGEGGNEVEQGAKWLHGGVVKMSVELDEALSAEVKNAAKWLRGSQSAVLRLASRASLPLVANPSQAARPEGYFADAYLQPGERMTLEAAMSGNRQGRADARSLWSAPAERSGDGALIGGLVTFPKAASRCACRRTPKSCAHSDFSV